MGTYTIPAARRTTWNPGVTNNGGIPNRTTIYATHSAGTAMSTIQTSLNNCPSGQVVLLLAGDYSITGGGLIITKSGVTLRGTLDANGKPATRLLKTAGSGDLAVFFGPTRWPKLTASVNLASNASKGATSFTLVSNPGIVAGDLLVISQTTDSSITYWGNRTTATTDASRGWFGEQDRPIGQVVEVDSVNGNIITINTPLHSDFSTTFTAHVSRYSGSTGGSAFAVSALTKQSGIENIYIERGEGGDYGGSIVFYGAAYCWAKNVECYMSTGSSVNFIGSFRCELRDSYVHETTNPTPGGAGYGLSVNRYAADNLIENNAVWNFNKVIVFRTSGGGNVVGYNYMEDGYVGTNKTWIEVGLNASHMTTPHQELFEGNQCWNFDSDVVWGNSVNITVFRNNFTGRRRSLNGLGLTETYPRRMAANQLQCWGFNFVGNVLGYSGMTLSPQTSWMYDKDNFGGNNNAASSAIAGVWSIGWSGDGSLDNGGLSAPQDAAVLADTIRDGNFDYVSNELRWHGEGGAASTTPPTDSTLPDSLYLASKPSFFGTRAWPWVTPESGTKLATLPARATFDGEVDPGTPIGWPAPGWAVLP
jgi:hypothetical protein